MSRTLLLYDGKMSSAERIAQTLCCLIGNGNAAEISSAPQNFADYDGYCFVFNFYGAVTAGRTRSFLIEHRDVLAEKRIAFVGIGFSDIGYAKYVSDTETAAGISGIAGYFISSERDTPRTGYEIGKMMRAPVHVMPDVKLERAIDDFIIEHNTLCLATADEGYVRCTPLEYIFLEHKLYIITEGGNKFRGILGNGQISAAIFDPYVSTEDVRGLQIMGNAELVEDDSVEYFTVLEQKEITADSLAAMPVKLFVVRITPYSYEFTDSAFVRDGYDAKQIMDTEFLRENWEAGALYAEHTASAGNAAAGTAPEEADEYGAAFGTDSSSQDQNQPVGQGTSEEAESLSGADKDADTWQNFRETEQPAEPSGEAHEAQSAKTASSENEETEAAAAAPDYDENADSDAFLEAAGDVTRQASDAEEAIHRETAAAEDGSDLKDKSEEEKKTDTDGLPVLDMSVIDGLVPGAEKSEEDGTDSSEYDEDDLNAKKSLLSRISQKRSLDEEREERREKKKDRKKKSGESVGSRIKSWLEDFDDDDEDDDEDTEEKPKQENSEERRTYSFYEKDEDEASEGEEPEAGTPDYESPSGAEQNPADQASAEKTSETPETEEADSADMADRAAASRESDEKRAETGSTRKSSRQEQKSKSGSFLSRLGHTIGTFLSVDEEDTSEDDDDDDEDDLSLRKEHDDDEGVTRRARDTHAEMVEAPEEDKADSEKKLTGTEKKPEKKPEKKHRPFQGMTHHKTESDDDDLDDDDLYDDDDDFGDEEDEEFEEEISRKSGPGVRDDEAALESDDVDARYAKMLDHGKKEKKHGESALPSFLRHMGKKAEERIAAEKEKEEESAESDGQVHEESAETDEPMHEESAEPDEPVHEEPAPEDASAQSAGTEGGEPAEHITADEEEVVDDADESDDEEDAADDADGTDAPDGDDAALKRGEVVFDFSVDDEPYEEDLDSDPYPDEETAEPAEDVIDSTAQAEEDVVDEPDSGTVQPEKEIVDEPDSDAAPADVVDETDSDAAQTEEETAPEKDAAQVPAYEEDGSAKQESSATGSYYMSHDMSELTGSHTGSSLSDEPRRTSAGPDIPEFMMKRNHSAHRHAQTTDFRDDLAVHDTGNERREREAKNAAIDAAVREARDAGHTVDVSGKAAGSRRKKKKHRR